MSRSPDHALRMNDRWALTRPEAADFARHLTGLAEAGLPLPAGLRALSLELPNGALRRMLGDLASRVEEGQPLESALQVEGSRLPAPLRGLIVAGVRTGRLAETLGRYIQMNDLEDSLHRRLRMGLIYPATMFMVSFCLFVFVARITTKGFKAIFDDFSVRIPWITTVLLNASEGFSSLGLWVLIGPIVGLAVMWLAMRFTLGRVERGRLIHTLPLIGPLARDTALAQFCPILEMLLESGIPLPEAMRLAADSTADPAMAEAARDAAREVEEGRSFAESVRGRKPFPTGFDTFLAWAEENRGLGEALRLSAESFEARAGARAVFIGRFCNIATMTAVMWWVGLTVVAMFLPVLGILNFFSNNGPINKNGEWPEALRIAGVGVSVVLGVVAVFALVWTFYLRSPGDTGDAARRQRPTFRFAHYSGMGWLLAGLGLVSLLATRLLALFGGEWLPDWWKFEAQAPIDILSAGVGAAGLLMVALIAIARRVIQTKSADEHEDSAAVQASRIRLHVPTWQFGLRHMMFAMAPIALLMVLFREFGFALLSIVALLIPPIIAVAGFVVFNDRRTMQRDTLMKVMAMAARDARPLGPAVSAFVPSCRGRYARRVDALDLRLERGDPLPDALDAVPKVLSRTGAIVARVGWETGTLGRMLDDALAAAAVERAARGSARSKIVYSLAVATIILSLGAFMTIWVGPHFVSIFNDVQLDAYKPTWTGNIFIDAFDPRRPASPLITGSLILGAVIAGLALAVFLIRRFLDAVPLADRLNRRGHAAVILRAHAAAVEIGQTVPSVLNRLAAKYPREWVRGRLANAAHRVERGEPWVESLRVEGVIGQVDAALLNSAERLGNLPWALRQAADGGERRQTYRLMMLGQVFQVASIGGLGLIVFLFAFSYFRPLVVLIELMSRNL